MSEYIGDAYRKRVISSELESFRVVVKETDIWVSADRHLLKETRDLIFECREQLENYIRTHPEFLTTLEPYPEDPYAPQIVKGMIKTTRGLGLGPMASVAGAIAQFVAHGLLSLTDQVIVENGGDIFLKVNRPVTVSIFAGKSPLSEKFGLLVPVRLMPLGICSSSGTVGHSLSLGDADVVCLLSFSSVFADGAATALANTIKEKDDLEKVAQWGSEIGDILGGVVIMGDRMAVWGDIELVDT